MEWWVSSSNSSVVCKLVCDIETTKKQVEVRKGNNRDKRREEREEKRENQRSDKSKKRGQRRKKLGQKRAHVLEANLCFSLTILTHTHWRYCLGCHAVWAQSSLSGWRWACQWRTGIDENWCFQGFRAFLEVYILVQRGRQGGDFNEPLTSVVSNLGTCGFVGPNCWFPGEDSGSVDLVVVVSQLFVPTDLVKFHISYENRKWKKIWS